MPEVHLVTPAPGEPGGRESAVVLNRFPCVVGRHSACDRRLPDPSVSRRHCAFELKDGRVWAEDLGSLNGTRLNGEPLTAPRPLADGDRLELADLAFVVRLTEARAEDAPAGDLPGADADADAAETMPLREVIARPDWPSSPEAELGDST